MFEEEYSPYADFKYIMKSNEFAEDEDHKGLLYYSPTYGAQDYLVYNDKTGVAIVGNRQADRLNILASQLEICKRKELRAKVAQLKERGYRIYNVREELPFILDYAVMQLLE